MIVCNRKIFGDICQAASRILDIQGRGFVECEWVSQARMRQVNATQRGVDSVTDVLSFGLIDAPVRALTAQNYPFEFIPRRRAVLLGTVLISRAVARRQALEFGHSVQRELGYLFVHGLLHLLGFDHNDQQSQQLMRQREEEILAAVDLVRQPEPQKRCGFVAIIGRPNVGKSTLLNALVGEKVSIVSDKPQTTRNRILGIWTLDDTQIVFIDTPGFVRPQTRLNKFMAQQIRSSLDGLDALVYAIDGSQRVSDDELRSLDIYARVAPLVVVITKTDLGGFDRVYPLLERLKPALASGAVREVVPLCVPRGQNVELLRQILDKLMPASPHYFDGDVTTDRPMRFVAAEIIREKALRCLSDEVPHGVGVSVTEWRRKRGITHIQADLVVEKASHKIIVIGSNGTMLTRIGKAARADLEQLVDGQVNLKLFVKVRESWRDDANYMRDLDYDQ